jgi:hypothetical protein
MRSRARGIDLVKRQGGRRDDVVPLAICLDEFDDALENFLERISHASAGWERRHQMCLVHVGAGVTCLTLEPTDLSRMVVDYECGSGVGWCKE